MSDIRRIVTSYAGDGIGNQGENAQRRKCNHHFDDLDDDSVETLEEIKERLRLFLRYHHERHTHKEGDKHHIEHVAIVRGGPQEVFWNHIDQRL